MHLLKYFDKLSLKPENAKELKGLILDLAIRGRLTVDWRKENPDVEPASVLLEKIKDEKARLIREKKIRKEKELGPIVKQDVLFSIPSSWQFEKLGSIGDWGAGATPKRTYSEYYGGDINWFKSGELNNGVIDFKSKETITDIALEKTSVRLNKPGDILIAMYGATIGKTARLEVIGTTNQAVCACTCYKGVFNRFLHLLLVAMKPIFTSQGEGGAQPNISRVKIRNQSFPLPPLAEQKAIVKIVNQLMVEVDQLEASAKTRIQLRHDFIKSSLRQLTNANSASEWKKLQPQFTTFFDTVESIDKLKEAILQLAVQGKLTKQWRKENPDVEPASVLLERIKTEKARLVKEKKIRKEKPLPEIAKEEIPFEVPEGWVWCRMGDVIKEKPRNGYSPKGVSFVTNTKSMKLGATTKGFFNPLEIKYLNEEIPEDSYLWLNPGDILIQRSNSYAYVGVSAIYDGEKGDFVYPDLMMKIRADESVSIEWLHGVLSSPFTRNHYRSNASGTSGNMPKINQGTVVNTPVALPSAKEQKAIVQIANQLMSYCDQMKAEVENRSTLSKDFLKSSIREVMEETQALA